MADYKVDKFRRNHFFYGKLMTVRDFEVEQGYMNGKRHLLTRLIDGTGIVCGLDDAEVYSDGENVKIKFKTGGFAIDSGGREIIIPAESDRGVYIKEGQTKVNLTRAELETSRYYVYLEYKPVFAEPVNSSANPSSCEKTCSPNRVIEDFELVASGDHPEADAVVCPDLSGNINADTARKRIKEWFKSETSTLCCPGDGSRVFLLALESAGGEVSVNAVETAKYLSFIHNSKLFAELLTCHLSDFDNPHKITAKYLGALKSVDGVSNPGGDVDLVQGNSIVITADNGAKTITIGETHSERNDNPHHVTAQQVGALSSVDGVANPGGNVDLVRDNSITITANDGANTITIGETHSARTGNPHKTKHEDINDVLPVFGDTDNDVRNKHVSNNDAEKWNNAAAAAGLYSIEGVDNPGGNIDLAGQNAIEILPDNVAKRIVINENHSTDTDNPHKTTAAHVGALSTKGGTVEGDVTVNGSVGIGTANPSGRLDVNGEIHMSSPDTEGIYGIELKRIDENNRFHMWKLWHMNHGYGKNSLQLWEYKADSKGESCGGNVNDGAMCDPRVTVAEGGNVGIGTAPTTYKLQVQGDALFTGNYLYVNSENAGRLRVGAAWGMPGLYSSDDAERDLTLGVPVGRKVYLGTGTGDAWVEGGSGNAYFKGTTVANVLQLGNKWRFSAVGDAHGNDEWLRMFNVANTGYYGGFAADKFWSQAGAYQSSDLQLKKDIKPLDSSLTKLGFLRGVRFKWKNHDKDDSYKIGLIAQEVEPVFPELIENGPYGMKSLNYTGLIPPLIEAIKEQQKKIEGLIGAAKGNDYAEYFESKSGKAIKPGTSIVLDDVGIRPAKENEIPIGIISANPGILGGMYMEWPKKYLRDEFGNQIMEEYREEIMVPKKEKIKKERQKMEKKKIKEKVTRTEIVKIKGKYCQKEITETIEREIEEPVFKEVELYDAGGQNVIGKHRVPVMETYEEEIDVPDEKGQPVMVGSGKFETKTRPKINPEYDETKEYIPREKRPEWNCVGLLGQLPLRKGQPVAPAWVKIKDLSEEVELWLVK
jgi:hypothetical protein